MHEDAESAGFSEPIDVPDETTPSIAGPHRSRRLARRTVVVSVIAVGVAAGGGAIAAAAGGHGGGASNRSAGAGGGYGMAGPEGGGMPGGGRPGAGDPMMRSIHGIFVVPSTANGKTTYVTEVQQTGTVTALSSSSISLRSADGYAATYAISSSTKRDSTVTNGSTATVVATGDAAAAVMIHGAHPRGPGGLGERPGNGGTPPSGAPAADGESGART